MKPNKVMIVGANFSNKGAQSMLFITIDEIRKRFPQCEIVFLSKDTGDFSMYRMQKIPYSKEGYSFALGRHVVMAVISRAFKDIGKIVLGHRNNLWHLGDIKRIVPTVDLIIDISGFNIGSKWSSEIQEIYLDNIRIAKKNNIPIYIMPQSFGPFDYKRENQYILKDISLLFPYAKRIYARENEGYELLIQKFNLVNVEKSTDLVLQNKGVDLDNIFVSRVNIVVPSVHSNSVGIVPNMQCFRYGEKELLINTYERVIKLLLDKGKNVYIFRHSYEDLDACKEISRALNNEHVFLIENDFSCLEYDAFVKQFDFLICSRYHGIVHAYRNCVPCILLGWAVKYFELANLFGQGMYSFDITDEDFNINSVINAVEYMCENHLKSSDMIKEQLKGIQEDNCFSFLDEL